MLILRWKENIGGHKLMAMRTEPLPSREAMIDAMLAADPAYEGVFFTAVRTTGIFCRPTCSAKKPFPANVVFYRTAEDALAAGYRPCLRCKPLDARGTAPEWVRGVLEAVDRKPARRWTEEDIAGLQIYPLKLRRWFKENYGTTFHTYIRARRRGLALGSIARGASIDDAASNCGYSSLSGFRDAVQRQMRTTPGRARSAVLLSYTRLITPLGPMVAMAEPNGLVMLEFIDRPALAAEVEELRSDYGYVLAPGTTGHIDLIAREVAAYFAGELQQFTVPLVTPGSEFQRRVWDELRKIPYGVTATYGAVARALGSGSASRAVGRANGQNRISIVIPCHRVIGADGTLTGYGGGQPRKEFLLALERRTGSADPAREPCQQDLFQNPVQGR